MKPSASGIDIIRTLFSVLGGNQQQAQPQPQAQPLQQERPLTALDNPQMMLLLEGLANVLPNAARAADTGEMRFDPRYSYQDLFQEKGVPGAGVLGTVADVVAPDPMGPIGDIGRFAPALLAATRGKKAMAGTRRPSRPLANAQMVENIAFGKAGQVKHPAYLDGNDWNEIDRQMRMGGEEQRAAIQRYLDSWDWDPSQHPDLKRTRMERREPLMIDWPPKQ